MDYKSNYKSSFKIIRFFVKKYKKSFIFIFILFILDIVFSIIQPFIFGKFVENLSQTNIKLLISICFVLFSIDILQLLFNYLRTRATANISNTISLELKLKVYTKILNLPFEALKNTKSGELISRIHNDTSIISEILSNQLFNVIIDIFRTIVIGFAILKINLILFIISIISLPITYLFNVYFGKKIREISYSIKKINDNYFSTIEESIKGFNEIKVLNLTNIFIEKFKVNLETLKNMNIKMVILNQNLNCTIQGENVFLQLMVSLVCIYLFAKNLLSISSIIAFLSLQQQFTYGVQRLTNVNSRIQELLVSMNRILELYNNLNYQCEFTGSIDMSDFKGNIKIENLCFTYKNVCIFNKANLDINNKNKIAIIGKSGCGKTTFLNLILRNYKINKGKILIDNINLEDLSSESIQRLITIVPQTPFLFNVSIKENLLMANANANDYEIEYACKLANIHDFIGSLPGQYEYVVQETGNNLSKGQIQRIAIARAILTNSKIMLFDEITSALDIESKHLINESIDVLSRNHMIIVVTHDLSMLKNFDLVISIENESIITTKNYIDKKFLVSN